MLLSELMSELSSFLILVRFDENDCLSPSI
jgi:hypothetical protein